MTLHRRTYLTITVAAIGAAAGAATGAAIASAVLLTSRHASPQFAAELYKLGMQTGASLGAVLGPLTAFTVLRRIPLGRLFWQTAFGAAIGGLVAYAGGSIITPGHYSLITIVGFSVTGFGTAATRLWRRFPSRAARAISTAG